MLLNLPIEKAFRLTAKHKSALNKIGLKTIRDLLFYFPNRYESFSERKNIIDLAEGDKTTVYGRVIEVKKASSFHRGMSYTTATIGDMTGTINAIWFRQPYFAGALAVGDKVALTGKISHGKSGLYISNPAFEKINSYEALGEGAAMLAMYPETKGITSRWIRHSIKKVLGELEIWPTDPIPEEILAKYHLPSLKSSLVFIHTPQKNNDAEAARKRFAFEEIFFIQLARMKQKKENESEPSFNIETNAGELEKFLKVFPFALTNAQTKAIGHIVQDFDSGKPMSRLLEGDVGSGKTAVAVAAVWMAVKSGYQVAYMAPTEILAQQHFQSFIKYFSQLRLVTKIGLITSSECKKFPSKVSPTESTHISKAQLLKWVENNEIPILIGTHSLIQKSVRFSEKEDKGLALVIIDEQHRFGARQRAALAIHKHEKVPHLLSMTATPIPRTLALTIYGDLDLSVLDEMPAGRKGTITEIVKPEYRQTAYEKIREEINAGRQAYVICPKIEGAKPEAGDENSLPIINYDTTSKINSLPTTNYSLHTTHSKKSDPLADSLQQTLGYGDAIAKKELKAVKDEATRLKKEIFQEFEIAILHGKMSPQEKNETLTAFRAGKIQILVATSVIEVGIDVPNATMIIIEGADRFGLAQLHQLRGRVIRGTHQSYCFVFAESNSQTTVDRLSAFVKAKTGFELAEYDLQLRGPGELGGGKQWGVSDLGMEALKNLKMVEAARLESQKLLSTDPDLKKYPILKDRLNQYKCKIHFE